MNFDEYWSHLIKRVYHQHETLTGVEEQLYRLTCILGETMVDGVEAYFERRWREFLTDQQALQRAGFADVAADYQAARRVMFGGAELTESLVDITVERLLEETDDVQPTLTEIGVIYDRLIARAPEVMDYRYQLGLDHGLYEPDRA